MIEFRRLTADHEAAYLPAIAALIEEERRRGDSLMMLFDRSFYRRFFTPGGAVLAAIDGQELKGFALLGLSATLSPMTHPYIDEMGVDRRDCGLQCSVVVNGSCRGTGMGSELYRRRIVLAGELGVKHLFSIVHPDNRLSLRLLEKHAFSAIDRLRSYKGAGPRVVFYKPLGHQADVDVHRRLGRHQSLASSSHQGA